MSVPLKSSYGKEMRCTDLAQRPHALILIPKTEPFVKMNIHSEGYIHMHLVSTRLYVFILLSWQKYGTSFSSDMTCKSGHLSNSDLSVKAPKGFAAVSVVYH